MKVYLKRTWFVGGVRYKKNDHNYASPHEVPDEYRDSLPPDAKLADEAAPVKDPRVEKDTEDQAVVEAEFVALTGLKPSQLVKVMGWLEARGLKVGNLQTLTLEPLAGDPTLDEEVQQALKLYLKYAQLRYNI